MLTSIPERARQILYAAYALLVLVAGAVSVGYNSAGNGQPTWLDVALDVLAYAGAALGITAAANVGNVGPPPPAIGDDTPTPPPPRDQLGQSLVWVIVVVAVVVLILLLLFPALRH